MEKVLAYAKAHPWATGIIVVVGGIIFLSITGIFGSSGGSGSSASDEPSDAEIMANATIQSAQIQAQAQAGAIAAELQKASMGYGYQLESDKLNAEIAFRNLDVQKELGLAGINYQRDVDLANIGAQRDMFITNSNNQVATQQIIANASKSKNKTNVIGSVLGGAIGVLGGIFSDSKLKTDIRYIGHNGSHGLYEFRYRGSRTKYIGVMAEEVARSNPNDVRNVSGFLMVSPKSEFIPRLNIAANRGRGGPEIVTVH